MMELQIGMYRQSGISAAPLVGLLILLCLIILTLPQASAAESKNGGELAAYKELSQIQLQATKDLLQKDIQSLSERIDMQDNRIDTQNTHIDHSLSLFDTALTVLGLVLTLAAVGGYFSVQRKAQKEAQAAAASWFRENEKNLTAQLDALQARLHQMEGDAEMQVNEHLQRVQVKAEQFQQQIAQRMSEFDKPTSELPAEAAEALAEVARAATNKPESGYTFQDWTNRAYAAYIQDDKDGAARFWQEAANHPSANSMQVAGSLFNAGVSLGSLKRYEEAIAVYNKVVERFGNNKSTAIMDVVASSLVNKGVSLGEVRRNEDAIEAFNLVIERFDKAEFVAYKMKVAKALVNKGHLFGRMGRYNEATAIYDAVIERFENEEPLELKEQVAFALNGKGYTLLCRAKDQWSETEIRIELLHKSEALFSEAAVMQPENEMVVGNQAYCAYLLGQPQNVVRDILVKALQLGGQTLYDATLGDLDIHPVSEDAGFRRLLDELWAEERIRSAQESEAK